MSDVLKARRCDVCENIYEVRDTGEDAGKVFSAKITIAGNTYEDFCPECRGKLSSFIGQLVKYKGDTVVLRK